jgi:hypothetical protein
MRAGKDHPCVDCGVQYPAYVMQFDHLPQHEKLFILSEAEHYGHQKIVDEIAKCEVVCTNCHLQRTYKRKHPGV